MTAWHKHPASCPVGAGNEHWIFWLCKWWSQWIWLDLAAPLDSQLNWEVSLDTDFFFFFFCSWSRFRTIFALRFILADISRGAADLEVRGLVGLQQRLTPAWMSEHDMHQYITNEMINRIDLPAYCCCWLLISVNSFRKRSSKYFIGGFNHLFKIDCFSLPVCLFHFWVSGYICHYFSLKPLWTERYSVIDILCAELGLGLKVPHSINHHESSHHHSRDSDTAVLSHPAGGGLIFSKDYKIILGLFQRTSGPH